MENQELIEAKDLKIGDLFKLRKAKRIWNTVTQIVDLDPEGKRESQYFKNKLLILDGCRQFGLDKSREVIRYNSTINS